MCFFRGRAKYSRLEADALEKDSLVAKKEEHLKNLAFEVRQALDDVERGVRPRKRVLRDVDVRDPLPAPQPSEAIAGHDSPHQNETEQLQDTTSDPTAAPDSSEAPMASRSREDRLSEEAMTPKFKKMKR